MDTIEPDPLAAALAAKLERHRADPGVPGWLLDALALLTRVRSAPAPSGPMARFATPQDRYNYPH